MAKSAKKTTLTKELQARVESGRLASAWSPLRESVFRTLWIATVVSNIGTWMQDVGESWLMTSLTSSPVLVALVETAAGLPLVLVALPSGWPGVVVAPSGSVFVAEVAAVAAARPMVAAPLLALM